MNCVCPAFGWGSRRSPAHPRSRRTTQRTPGGGMGNLLGSRSPTSPQTWPSAGRTARRCSGCCSGSRPRRCCRPPPCQTSPSRRFPCAPSSACGQTVGRACVRAGGELGAPPTLGTASPQVAGGPHLLTVGPGVLVWLWVSRPLGHLHLPSAPSPPCAPGCGRGQSGTSWSLSAGSPDSLPTAA